MIFLVCEQKNIIGIGLVSFFIQFGSTFIYTTSPKFIGEKLFGDEMTFLLLRNIGESTSIFYKLLSGYLSDTINDRKSFLYMGYCSVIVFKGMFWLISSNLLSNKVCAILFLITHVMDRMMNSIRDAPRDALLFASSRDKESSFAIRKIIGTSGSILAGILCIFIVKYDLILPSKLYGLALIPIMIANIILYTIVKDINSINNNVTSLNIDYPKIIKQFTMIIVYSFIYYLFFIKSNNNIIFLKLLYGLLSCSMIFDTSIFNINYLVSYIFSTGTLLLTLSVLRSYNPLLENIIFPLFITIIYNFMISDTWNTMKQYDLSKYYILLIIALCISMSRLNDSLYFKVGEYVQLGGSKNVSMIVMFTINYIWQLLLSLWIKKYFKKFTPKILLFLLIISLILCNIICFYSTNVFTTILLAIILGIVNSGYDFVMSTMIASHIPDDSIKGTMFGVFYFVVGFSNVFSTLFNNNISLLFKNLSSVAKIQYTSIYCIPFSIIAAIFLLFL